jgi:hypothetical protein
MISPETEKDILAEMSHSLGRIEHQLGRIAVALETFNNAAIRGMNADSEGQIEIFATTHSA